MVEPFDLAGLDGERAPPLAQPDVDQVPADLAVLHRVPNSPPPSHRLPVVRRAPPGGLGRQILHRPPPGGVRLRACRFGHAIGVRAMELQERVHLRIHLLRRAVLVDETVVPPGVVRPLLVGPLPQRDLDPLPGDTVDAHRRVLVPGHDGVEGPDRRVAERCPALRQVEDGFESLFLVLEQPPQRPVLQLPGDAVRSPNALETLRDQLFGDAPAEEIEALDLPGLDGEVAIPLAEPDVHEGAIYLPILEFPPGLPPLRDGLPVRRNPPTLRFRGQVGDPTPARAVGLRARWFRHAPNIARRRRRRGGPGRFPPPPLSDPAASRDPVRRVVLPVRGQPAVAVAPVSSTAKEIARRIGGVRRAYRGEKPEVAPGRRPPRGPISRPRRRSDGVRLRRVVLAVRRHAAVAVADTVPALEDLPTE